MKRSTITIDNLRTQFLAVLLLLAVASDVPAVAHPHAWIDLRSTVVLDAAGRVTAIEQQWLFDQFYTVFATEGLSGAAGAAMEGVSSVLLRRRSVAPMLPVG